MPATRGKPTMYTDEFVSVTNKFDENFWGKMRHFAKKNGIPSVPFYISYVMHQCIAAEEAKEARERAKEVRDRQKGLADA